MRKLIEDLHISVGEKDAEIIKLRMNLTDERQKVHQASRKQLHPVRDEQAMSENENLVRQIEEMGRTHKAEIEAVSDKFKQQLLDS